MNLLLDTHVAVWSIIDDPRLGPQARGLISDQATVPVVSVVSIWEIAIKFAFGRKRRDPIGFSGGEARSFFEQAGYAILPVTAAHAVAVDNLPPLHGDPFDRMLVAQALTEPMHLLTRDLRLADYGSLVMVV